MMDVRDMSAFNTKSFAAVIDKGSGFTKMRFAIYCCSSF